MEYRIVYDKIKDRYKAQKKGTGWWFIKGFWRNIIIPSKFFFYVWTHSKEDVEKVIDNDKKWEGIKEIIRQRKTEMKQNYIKKKKEIGKKRFDFQNKEGNNE